MLSKNLPPQQWGGILRNVLKREYQRQWRDRNRDSIREKARQWYHSNKSRVSEQRGRKWRTKHPTRKPRRTPEEVRRQLSEAACRFQAKRNIFYWTLKSLFRCMDCGEQTPACLDFHHRNPADKSMGIGQKARMVSRQTLMKEILKCDVICSNCHRKRHYKERSGLTCERLVDVDRTEIEKEARAFYEEYIRQAYAAE